MDIKQITRKEGKKAFKDGKQLSECPYPYTSNAGKGWREGYCEAAEAKRSRKSFLQRIFG